MTGRIVDAGWQLLLETGPETFSIDRLSGAARISKQTIYARFSGKAPLLGAIQASRVEVIFGELRQLNNADTVEAAFAELAGRLVQSLTHPEARMLDRLTDWLDACGQPGTGPASGDHPHRLASYNRLREQFSRQLEAAMQRWPVMIEDVPRAAEFWIDGLVGHARGLPLDDTGQAEWARSFARYFLNAVSQRA